MNKPGHLRAWLTASLDARHHLSADPSRLHMTATEGTVLASARPGSGFSYQYTLEIILLDFTGKPEEITVPLMIWVQRYQPDLVSSPQAAKEGISLTVSFLESGKVDVLVDLKLTESVRYVERQGGGHNVEYLEEAVPMALREGSPLHAVYMNDELIMHCEAHPGLGLD